MKRGCIFTITVAILVTLSLFPVLSKDVVRAQEFDQTEAQSPSVADVLATYAAKVQSQDAGEARNPSAQGAAWSGDFGGSNGGSAYPAPTAASTTWYFAEGCSEGNIYTLLNVVNPGSVHASATVSFYTNGIIPGPTLELDPGESKTIDIGDWVVSDEVGMSVVSTQPVIAQRTMYGLGVIETNPGGISLSTTHYFADGRVSDDFSEWINIINPGGSTTDCTVSLMTDTGPIGPINVSVGARSRKTLFLNDIVSSGDNVSVEIGSTQAVYAERTMLFYCYGYIGVHISPGADVFATDWYFPAVTSREGFEAWLVINNPQDLSVIVSADLYPEGQEPVHSQLDVVANSVLYVYINSYVVDSISIAIHVHSDNPIVCELTSFFGHESDYLEGNCDGGNSLPGNTSLAKSFVLPGGSQGSRHEQWITLSNFGASAASVQVKAYTSQGTVTKTYSIPKTQGKIVNTNQDIVATGEIYYIEVTSASDIMAGKADFYSSFELPLPPGADYAWFFAEGCTRAGFSEYICLQNPGDAEIQVHAVYMLFGVPPYEEVYPVPANSRNSLYVNSIIGNGQDVSVMLWSEDEFYAERPMYFNYKQGQPGYSWDGGHVTFGVEAPRTEWYFAEGYTGPGFEEWLCIQNPTDTEAEVLIEYIMSGEVIQKLYSVSPQSRFSVNVNTDIARPESVSAAVYSSVPIVCERPMYFSYGPAYNQGPWTGGHVVMGTTSPKTEWYFAEGCTRSGFEEWICIQNPNSETANLDVTYATSDGVIGKEYSIPGVSRYTLNVNNEVGLDKDVSCHISSDQPIICERPLYFNYTGYGAPGWTGGSAEVGVTAPKTEWYFAEGYTGGSFHEWICVQNTAAEEATVTVTYNIQGAAPQQKTHKVPPGRYTIFVNQDAGPDLQLSTHLSSDKPIICERSMYFSYNDWNGGHCASGFAP